MTKWEYQLVHVGLVGGGFHYINYSHMEILGKEGWELVAIYDRTAYFKRPLKDDNGEEKKAEIEEEKAKETGKEDEDKQEDCPKTGHGGFHCPTCGSWIT